MITAMPNRTGTSSHHRPIGRRNASTAGSARNDQRPVAPVRGAKQQPELDR